tara:strand:+ start:2169 stop:3059 length:891 start_codon:yes stop_codon:yes gene_type:complete
MKKLIIYIGVILLSWLSCDKIEAPYTTGMIAAEKTILIEKFTAHECQNCPEASRIIEDELKPTFVNSNDISKSAIIAVALHPGQSNLTNTSDNYDYNFTTESSNQIADYFGIHLATALPKGGVNRIEQGNSNRLWNRDKWSELVENQLLDANSNPIEKNIDITINTSLNTTNKTLVVSSIINVLNNLEGNYYLALFIMEDSIIAPQKDGLERIENYRHDHVYRCAINEWNGEPINTDLQQGTEWSTDQKTIVFNTEYNNNWTDEWNNINNCHVVGYIYNAETGIIEEAAQKPVYNE